MGPKQTQRPTSATLKSNTQQKNKKVLRSKSEDPKREKSPSREPSKMPKNKIVIAMNKLFDVANNNNYTKIDSEDISFKFYDNSKTKDSHENQPALGPVNAYIVDDNPDVLFAVEAKPLDDKIDQQTFLKLLDDSKLKNKLETLVDTKINEQIQPKQNIISNLSNAERDQLINKLSNVLKKDKFFTGPIQSKVIEDYNKSKALFEQAEHYANKVKTEAESAWLYYQDEADKISRNTNAILKHQLESKIEAAFKDKLFENKIKELEGKIKQNNSSAVNENELAEANSNLVSLQFNLKKQKLEEAVKHAFENKYLHQRIDTVNDTIKSEATKTAEAAKTAAETAVETEISSYTEQLKALEQQLKELQQPKEPNSPTSVSQNDLKSQLENAIQRELERAHLQQQITDMNTKITQAQEIVRKAADAADAAATAATSAEAAARSSNNRSNNRS